MNEKEIRQRINAFKAAAESDGFDSTYGWWILLQETTKAKNRFDSAIPLRELLGDGDGAVSEMSMQQHFGPYWRSKFTKQSGIGRGFIHRELSGCVFVSVGDGSANDVPTRNNILRRSDPEVKAIRYFIKKHVVFGEADGSAEAEEAEAIDEGAMNVEAGGNDTGRPATADDLDSKTLKRILCHLRVDDMMHSAARVSPKWRKAALDVVLSPDSHLESLPEEHIPGAVQFLGQQQDGLSHIFTLVRQNSSLQNAIGDVAIRAIKQRVADAPTIDNCVRFIEAKLHVSSKVDENLQSLAYQILKKVEKEQQQQQEQEQEHPQRRRQKKQQITLKYFASNKTLRSCKVEIVKSQRTCKPTSSDTSKQKYICRVANAVHESITDELGANFTEEKAVEVLKQLAKGRDLTVFDASKMVFSVEECVSLINAASLSINQLCTIARFMRVMRPDFQGLIWMNQLKKQLSKFINKDNLDFIVRQLPLIVSKSEDKYAVRAFWFLSRPSELAELLTERSILDGSFEESLSFCLHEGCVIAIWGIDKAAHDTGCALRIGNRLNGNSSKHTQLLAATENAAECYTNIQATFCNPNYPLKEYLQQLVYDNYHMIIVTIGQGENKVCRCITYRPTPPPTPCTIRNISVDSTPQPLIVSTDDAIHWDEQINHLPHDVSCDSNDEIQLRLVQSNEEIFGIQVLDSHTIVCTSIPFMRSIDLASMTSEDLEAIKIVSKQILGFASNDYKLALSLTGICSASATCPCVSCEEKAKDFKKPSEALQRYRDPDKEPVYKGNCMEESRGCVEVSNNLIHTTRLG